MKKVFQKITALALGTAMLSGVGAQLGVLAKEDSQKAVASDTEQTETAVKETYDRFLLSSWVSFYDTDITPFAEQVEDFAKSGMNSYVWSLGFADPADRNVGPEYWTQMETEVSKYDDMTYVMNPVDLNNAQASAAYVKENNLLHNIGYHLKDEPNAAQIPALAELAKSYLEADPDAFPYINLFPNYAGASNLGGTYRDYVTNWVSSVGAENLEYLYFDHYPFTAFETVRSSYFSDLEVIRDVAYKNGKLKTGGFTQMGSWNGMARPTVDMARWSVNSLLSYGLKSLSHFNWVAPTYVAPEDGGEGMRDFVLTCEGEKTDLYEPMRALNWQVRQLGDVFMSMDVKHAYHFGSVPNGTEELPESFLIQPQSGEFIVSIAYGKNGTDKYVLLFNKATSGAEKSYTFRADLSSGLTGMTYFKPTDFNESNLPDPQNLAQTLGTPEEISVSVDGGQFAMDFLPGEMKVLRLNGDVTVNEELVVPESNVSSGLYSLPQTVELKTYDAGAEIYYTTDGSFPVPGKEGTTLYTQPFTVGSTDSFNVVCLRAVSVRGSEISELFQADMQFCASAQEISRGIIPQAWNDDFTKQLSIAGFNGSSGDSGLVTDGDYSPTGSVIQLADENGDPSTGWLVLDLGKEYVIDKISFSFWHDWQFTDVKIEIATKADFSDKTAVFAPEGKYQNKPTYGDAVTFSPTSARYVRIHCAHSDSSVYTEIGVFTAYESGGEDILSDKGNWKALGGSQWEETESGGIRLNGNYNQEDWNRAYSYTAKKYKNFMVDLELQMDLDDPGAWGYAGIHVLRPDIDDTQGDVGKGFVVGIEPRGRVLVWDGATEYGPRDANVAGWKLRQSNSIRIIVYNDTISVSVNGQPAYFYRDSAFNLEAGYISLHAGLDPITVEGLTVIPLKDGIQFGGTEQAIDSVESVHLAVDRFVSEQSVKEQLGDSVVVYDTEGLKHTVKVVWNTEDYDRTTTGTYAFYGTLDAEDLAAQKIGNYYNKKVKAEVFVKPELDTRELQALVDEAKGLQKEDYTGQTWATLEQKLAAAEDMLNNPFLVESDLGVGLFQLYDAIHGLESVADKTMLQVSITNAEEIEANGYSESSFAALRNAIDNAKAVLADTTASSKDIEEAENSLKAAMNGLEASYSAAPSTLPEKPESVEKRGDTTDPSGCGSALGVESILGAAVAAGAVAVIGRKRKK